MSGVRGARKRWGFVPDRLRLWFNPGLDLVGSELKAAGWRGERDARVRRLREYASRSEGAKLKDRLESAMQDSLKQSGKPAMPLMLELSDAEMRQFNAAGVMAVPKEIVWPM